MNAGRRGGMGSPARPVCQKVVKKRGGMLLFLRLWTIGEGGPAASLRNTYACEVFQEDRNECIF